MTSVHLAETPRNDTLPNPRKVVSLSQPEFCQKVDVKEAATRVGGERHAAKLRLLQLFTYDFIYFIVKCCFFSSLLKPGRHIVRLCIQKRRRRRRRI